MAAKRPQGGGSNGISSNAAPSATHVYASSLAVPIQSNLAHLESQLTSLSQRILPFLQRDVVLSRIDDTNPYRVELEAGDSSFAPIRRARIQSRLHVRFQNKKVELRVYAQGGSGAYKDSDLVNVRSLTCIQLEDSEDQDEMWSDSDEEDKERIMRDSVATEASKRMRKGEQSEVLPDEINVGGNHWRQITLAMGWIPHHTVIRSGHCFAIHQDKSMRVEVYLFHLLKLNEDTKPVTLQRASNTRILQAIVTIALPSKGEGGTVDVAKVSERAYGEIVKLQESLRGLVDLSKDVD